MTSTTCSISVAADYIIVGGGTAGLVLASRLSEDSAVHVMVLESGPDRTTDPQIKDPMDWQSLMGTDLEWGLKLAPQDGLNGRTQDHPAGRVLGGSSAINVLAFVAPSSTGIDAWEHLGHPGWNWATLALHL
ncbi:glucose-methanol-choline oxidoreductase [Aspergillus alliaceus]|uniref:Glucose-methanol-choline oxidoreductase n=1 Tax=Petromyces alliaceus TaxID=209559 RepID=A0A5N7BSD6_PETAA|nr:glucose-methanol-choline oxidoreductase [Aspergillus alliaceus]